MSTFRLLLVDDNERSLKLIKAVFDSEGFETTVAHDGAEAMICLQEQKPDLMITDVLMPNVDGYYLCHKIRMHDTLKDLPIIIYSGTFTSMGEDKVAKEMGANLFIRKPASKHVLVAAVRELLSAPVKKVPTIGASDISSELMHQYNASLIHKLEQRNILLEEAKQNLELIVETRTRELTATNEELLAANEELQAANEELTTLNDQLSVASDLIKKQSDIIISQKDEQLNRVLDSTMDVVWSYDLTGKGQDYISRSVQLLFGKSPEELIHKKWFWLDYTEPKNIISGDDIMADLEARGNVESTYQLHVPGKEPRWIFERSRLIRNRTGIPVRFEGILSDITDLKKAEENIREKERRYRDTLDSMIEGCQLIDFNWYYIYVNPSAARQGQKNPTDLMGHTMMEVYPGIEKTNLFNVLKKCMATRESIHFENDFKLPNGDTGWFDVRVLPSPEGLFLITSDISARKKSEQALQEYNKRYEIVSKATNDAIWDWDILQDDVKWNHGMQSIFGYPEKEIGTTKNWWVSKIHPTDCERVDKGLEGVFKKRGARWISQYRYLCADGSYKFVLDRAFILYQGDEPVRMIGSMQDITQQKKFEENITNIAHELTNLIETADVPIFGVDRNGYINEWNKVAAKLSSYTKNEVLGSKWVDLLAPKIHVKVDEIIKHVLSGKPASNYELPFISKSGKKIILLISLSPRRDINKNIVGAICIGQDLTEVIQYRKGLENLVKERTSELNKSLQKEKELVELKSKFISIASHEFRTPLSTISLSTGMIKKYKSKISAEELDKKLATIEKQVDHMTYLLDDVLMIGKAESGKIQIHPNEIKIKFFKKLAEETVKSAGTTHTLHYREKCKIQSVHTDEKLIRNIVINLLTNAIKFSPGKKEIWMTLSAQSKHLIITVKDNGIGIPPDYKKNLFTSFSRGSNVGNIDGTGLGLSIVKKAVELLQGSVTVKSKVGEGTEFKVTLPL